MTLLPLFRSLEGEDLFWVGFVRIATKSSVHRRVSSGPLWLIKSAVCWERCKKDYAEVSASRARFNNAQAAFLDKSR